MFLQLVIKVPQNLSERVENILYESDVLGWETQETGDFITYLVYSKDENSDVKELTATLSNLPEVEVSIQWIKEENWAEMWKENFKPIEVGDRLVIAPPWESVKEKTKTVVIIEPGQAFGTGHHPTTKLMLLHIEKIAEILPKGAKVLDLGCGTGILSIALLKLVPDAEVWAVDIDPEAISATLYNAKINQVEKNIITSTNLPSKKFDLIMANIGFRELKKLANYITGASKPNADAFLSGVLSEDKEELLEVYLNFGWKIKKAEDLQEWGFLWISR